MVTRNRVGTQAVSTVTAANTQSGGGGGGTSGSDNRVPSGPVTLTPSNLGVRYQAGAYLGTVTLTWVLPTTATDGSAMAPATSHLYQYGGAGTPGAFSQVTVLDYPDRSTVVAGYAPDSTWQFKVRCVAANGKVSAFSNIVVVDMPNSSAAGTPLTPSTPAVDPEGIVIRVRWDGLAVGGVPMPADFQYCEVQRAHSAAFTTSDIVPVGALLGAGDLYDGPLTPGDTWYYRLVAYNVLDQPGAPGGSNPATVGTIDGDSITNGSITTDQMNADLMALVNQAAANAPPPGGALPGNHIFYGTSPDSHAVIGDLWFNPNDNNIPYVLQGVDPTKLANWIPYRDKIVNDAFSSGPNKIAISAPYLLPDVVQTQLLLATKLIQAPDIIATNSITSNVGLFGTVDAAILNTGYIDAGRIHADSIDSTKLIVADLANLCDEPEFDGAIPVGPDTFDTAKPPNRVKGLPLSPPWKPLGWNDPNAAPAGLNGRRSVTDHPTANASTGYVYSVIGLSGASKQTIRNVRTFPALSTDQFFGQLWVRKIGAATTGTVTFALEVDLKAGGTSPDPTLSTPKTVFFSKTFLAADKPTTWTQLPILFDAQGVATPLGQNGSISPDQSGNPKPSDPSKPWTPVTQTLPTGSFQGRASIIVTNLALGQEIQIASVWVRRKGTGQLIVDGAITADHIEAGTITSGEIAAGAISATNIGVDSIYSKHIKTGTIQAGDMRADALSAFLVNAGVIRTVNMPMDTTVDPPVPIPSAKPVPPYFELSATQMIWQKDALPAPPLFQFLFGTGAMSFQSSASGTVSKWQLDTAGIRFYGSQGTAAPPTINLITKDGSAFFQGDLSGSKFTAGATPASSYLQTGSSGMRVVMDSTGLQMYNTKGSPVFALTNVPAANSPYVMLTSKPGRTNSFDAGWVLSDAGLFMYDGTHMTFGVYAAAASGHAAGDAIFRGTITASNIDALSTITGSLIQTSKSGDNPRISMNTTGDGATQVANLWVQDQYGSTLVLFKADKVNTNAAFTLDSNPQMTVAANVGHDQPRLLIDSLNYFRFYNGKKNSSGNWIIPFNIDFKSGSVTMIGTLTASAIIGSTIDTTSTITGAVVRTSSGTSRIEMADAGITHYLGGVALSSWSATAGINFKTDTSGARVVLSSTGLFLYPSTGSTPNVALYASNGSAHFTGSITAADGTFGGTLTAADGSFSGSISAATGSFNGIITGTINGVNASGGNVNNPGSSWGGGAYNSPSIGIGNGYLETSTGPNRIVLVGDEIQVWSGGNLRGLLYAYTASNDVTLRGYTSSDSVWFGYNSHNGGGQFQVANGTGAQGSITSAALRDSSVPAIAGYGQLYVSLTGAGYVGAYTSSGRYKSKVKSLDLDPAFMAIETSTWSDKPNLASMSVRVSHPNGRDRSTGFLAENLHKIGLRDTVVYDVHRRPMTIQQPAIMAHTVRYTQWLVDEVNELRARVAALEGAHA